VARLFASAGRLGALFTVFARQGGSGNLQAALDAPIGLTTTKGVVAAAEDGVGRGRL